MRRITRAGAAAALSTAAVMGAQLPARADPPRSQTFYGTLHFCEPACRTGALHATGPVRGRAVVTILSDRPNHDFTVSHVVIRLQLPDGSATLALIIRTTGDTVVDKCHILFTEAGRWRVKRAGGTYKGVRGEGVLQGSGLAANHAPGCPGTPVSTIDYLLVGHAHQS